MAHPCVGIDLGTTYSGIAVINPAGKPEIIPNAEGERITRSAVFFQDTQDVIVGQMAANAIGAYKDRVVVNVKRHMGDGDFSYQIDDKRYSPEEISAIILRKVKQDAETTLGPIKYAVITVPAYFNDDQRTATMNAAKLAGIEVLRIINEPTAAAIAYASLSGQSGTVLMYDFGGGTFDVSIVKITSPFDIEVIATAGDSHLGGNDLDERLASYWAELFSIEKGIDPRTDSGAWYEFLARAEEAKRDLSRLESASRMLIWMGAQSMNMEISRDKFVDLIGDEITRTKMLTENALDAAHLSPDDIDDVILVGGSTRIPAIQEMLKLKFGKEPVRKVNPDEVVALGASIQAGVIMTERGFSGLSGSAETQLRKTRIRDVTAHSLGTLALVDFGGVMRLRNSIIIPKNSPIPASETETYYTIQSGQTAVNCEVTQGEDEDPEFVDIKKQEILPLPPDRPAGQPIEVTFSYDSNGTIQCDFTDVGTGVPVHIRLDFEQDSEERLQNVDADFDNLEIS